MKNNNMEHLPETYYKVKNFVNSQLGIITIGILIIIGSYLILSLFNETELIGTIIGTVFVMTVISINNLKKKKK